MKLSILFTLLKIWNVYVQLFLKLKKFKKNNFKIKKLSILFVKPYNYLDIYTISFKNSKKTFLSSIYRFGPVGLLTDHKTDFCISDSYNDKKIDFEKFKINNPRVDFLKTQKKNSINLNSINFNRYDLVISFNDTVPERLMNNYRKTLWAKIYEDHKNPNFKKYFFIKPKKFDFVFNQTLGFTPYSLVKKSYWIDFSYTFGNSLSLKKIKLTKKKVIDIVTEVNQKEHIKYSVKKLKNFIFYCLDETLNHKEYINILSKGKFFLAVDCKSPRWGNSLIEAALCGNLLIGNRNHFWNSQLIIDELHCVSFNGAIKIIKSLKKDKNKYNNLLKKQNMRLNYMNYQRPLEQIINYAQSCKRELNIIKKK